MSRRSRAQSPKPPVPGSRSGLRARPARLAGLAVVALAAGVFWWGAGPAVTRPNVLLITIDTLRWDRVGCYGAAQAATPVLDGLAARGARFETAIMHAPLTAPSHASILTGLIPPRHGVRDNGAFVLPSTTSSLASVLRATGYATAGFVSGFPLDRRFGFAGGFDTYDDWLPRAHGDVHRGETERRADLTSHRVLAWLDSRSSGASPWFVWAHYFDPHAPYDPPPAWRGRTPGHPYDDEIAFVDAEIGRLIDRLQQRNELARTVILVTADHGESLGEHGEETHGVFVYDSTLRVPWIVAGPGIRPGVPRVVARGVDAMPTLLDLAHVPSPPDLDGRSLRPALEGGSMTDAPAYIEALLAMRHFGWAPLHGLRSHSWKYIEAPAPELYDLASDGAEAVNRVGDEPDRAASTAKQLDELLRAPTAAAREAPVERDTAERLRALGYVGRPSQPAGSAGRDPKDGIELITRVERAIATIRIDPRSAVEQLQAVLQAEPEIELARRELAVALSLAGDHRGAIREVRLLQSRGAATVEDLLVLSESLRVTGQTAPAMEVLDEAARIDPGSPEVPLTRARALRALGQPEGAAAALEVALERAPDNAEALIGLGDLALIRGDLGAAGQYFERVLARSTADPDARRRLGIVRGRQGRMQETIALLEPVVREFPDDGEALAMLGAALARSGSPATALPYFERALAAGLRTPSVLTGLGFARLEAGDPAGAAAALRASLAANPAQPGVERALRELEARASTPRGRQ